MTAVATEGPLKTARLQVHHVRTKPKENGLPRVLLLGGSNFDLRLKRAFLRTQLASESELATYEPRGIGRTEQPDGHWQMADYAKDALSVLDALGWDTANVVGESFGGMTALHLARLAPGRVERLIIASATAGGPNHASFDISAFLKLPRADAALQSLLLQDTRNRALRDADPNAFQQLLEERIDLERAFADPSIESGGYARLLEARRGHDCTGDLAAITTPTLILAGRYDTQSRPQSQCHLSDQLPNARCKLFEAGHGVLFASQDAMTEAVAFIRLDQSLAGA